MIVWLFAECLDFTLFYGEKNRLEKLPKLEIWSGPDVLRVRMKNSGRLERMRLASRILLGFQIAEKLENCIFFYLPSVLVSLFFFGTFLNS